MNGVTDLTLKDYWRIVRKRKGIIITTVIIICLIVYYQVSQATPIFSTSARVKVEQITTTLGVIQEMLTYGTGDYLETQKEVLLSDPVFERIGYRAGLIPVGWLQEVHPQEFEERFQNTRVEYRIGHILRRREPRFRVYEDASARGLLNVEPSDSMSAEAPLDSQAPAPDSSQTPSVDLFSLFEQKETPDANEPPETTLPQDDIAEIEAALQADATGAGTEDKQELQRAKQNIQNVIKMLKADTAAEVDTVASIIKVTVTKEQPGKYKGRVSTQEYVQILADLIVEVYQKESEYQRLRDKNRHEAEVSDKLDTLKNQIDRIKQRQAELDIPYSPETVVRDMNLELSPLQSQKPPLERELDAGNDRLNLLKSIEQKIEGLNQQLADENSGEKFPITEVSKDVRQRVSDLSLKFPEIYNNDQVQEQLDQMRIYEKSIQSLLETRTGLHPSVIQNKEFLRDLTRNTARRLYQLVLDARLREESRVTPIQIRYDELDAKITQLEFRRDQIIQNTPEYRNLQDELEVNERTYDLIQQEQLRTIYQDLAGGGKVEIVELARKPTEPESTHASTKVLAGGVVGLILGFVFAFIIESLDTSLGTVTELEEYLEVPVLGVIPNIEGKLTAENLPARLKNRIIDWKNARFSSRLPQGPPAPLIVHDPRSTIAEAMRSLRTNLMIQTLVKVTDREAPATTEDGRGVCFLMTSATPQEGKSTIVSNLAITIAQLGKKILLVDGDWRRPILHRVFGIENTPGIIDALIGAAPKEECIRSATDLLFGTLKVESFLSMPGIDRLQILPAGTKPPTPSELLASQEMTDFLEELRNEYDVILVDIPPVLPVTDATVLAPKTDGVILVYRAGKTTRHAPKRAIELLKHSGAPVLGVVLNDAKPQVDPDISYYYHYYYGEPDQPQDTRSDMS
ncbi:MAG: polysaccharide biosynthesis tyrosine autokinase [Candidatus Poribacteria bacterium]|nr:polysaccharide biosynthesis tyrosine autokinase [Candidatus Poribacteria bacterium]